MNKSFPSISNLCDEYYRLEESYTLLEEIWSMLDRYDPEINGKELPKYLQNRLQTLFGFDDSE
jgi:hypothetical protein